MALPKLTIYRGTDFEIPLAFLQPGGAPLDITGCTVYLTAKLKADDDASDAAAAFKGEASAHNNATGGLTSIKGIPADTQSSKPGEYLYDVEVKDLAGRITSFGIGKLLLVGEMTRRV